MKRVGHSRKRSGASWKFSALPDDLQTLIFELVEAGNPEAMLDKLESAEFIEWLIPLKAFPKVETWTDYRDEAYARRMLDVDLPPIVVWGRHWIDGRHRIWAWRQQGLSFARAIDLAEIGVLIRDPRLGLIQA